MQAFTGSDYTSAFHRIGKVKVFSILRSCGEYISAFKEVGTNFAYNYEYLPIIEKFACEMYGIKNCSSTNAARYKKFCSSKNVPEPQQLPPTKDALF